MLRFKTISTDFHDNYKLEKKIGEGTFATVQQGYHVKTKEKFAFKIYDIEKNFSELAIKQSWKKETVMQEIKILRKLHQTGNLVHLYEVHEISGMII